MFKLAGTILDSYDDPAFIDHEITKTAQSSGKLPSFESLAEMTDDSFAVIIKTASGSHRKYPIASPALVKLSAEYFNHYGHQMPEEMRKAAHFRIRAAAKRHGVKLAGVVSKAVLDPGVYSFSLSSDHQVVSMGTELMDKKAAFERAQQEFLVSFGRMAPAERAIMAGRLEKIGTITDTRITDYIPKSEYGPKFDEGMRQRVSVLFGDQVKLAMLQELRKELVDMDARRGAVILDEFDKRAGLTGRTIDAYRTCWGGFRKAAGVSGGPTQFGVGPLEEVEYRIETLARAHADTLKFVLDDHIVDAFVRDPIAYYRKSTGQVKRILKDLANQVGEENPEPEVKPSNLSYARGQIRTGTYTPWTKS